MKPTNGEYRDCNSAQSYDRKTWIVVHEKVYDVTNLVNEKCREELDIVNLEPEDPMEILCKYHVIIDEMTKETNCEWLDDIPLLEQAKELIEQFADQTVHDSRIVDFAKEVQISIAELMVPKTLQLKNHGKLLNHGDIEIKTPGDEQKKLRRLYVFEKAILMFEINDDDNHVLCYEETIRLIEYHVERTTSFDSIDDNSNIVYQWQLVHNTGRKSYFMYNYDEGQRDTWLMTLQGAFDGMFPVNCAKCIDLLNEIISCDCKDEACPKEESSSPNEISSTALPFAFPRSFPPHPVPAIRSFKKNKPLPPIPIKRNN